MRQLRSAFAVGAMPPAIAAHVYLLTIPAKQLECSTVCIDRRGFQSVTAHIALRCAATEGLLLFGSDECERGSLGVETKNDPKVAGYLGGPHEHPAVFSLDAC
jgi:hypothetical protein